MNRRQFLKAAAAGVVATLVAPAIPDPDEELWLFKDAANAGVTHDEIAAATECLSGPYVRITGRDGIIRKVAELVRSPYGTLETPFSVEVKRGERADLIWL